MYGPCRGGEGVDSSRKNSPHIWNFPYVRWLSPFMHSLQLEKKNNAKRNNPNKCFESSRLVGPPFFSSPTKLPCTRDQHEGSGSKRHECYLCGSRCEGDLLFFFVTRFIPRSPMFARPTAGSSWFHRPEAKTSRRVAVENQHLILRGLDFLGLGGRLCPPRV